MTLTDMTDPALTELVADCLAVKMDRARRLFDPRAGSCRLFPGGCDCEENCQPAQPLSNLVEAEGLLGYLRAYDKVAHVEALGGTGVYPRQGKESQ